jgi:ribonuclease HI
MSDPGVFTIYTDGAARGNPGPAAYAYIIERPGEDDIEFNQRLGDTTNNVAEYTALIYALKKAKALGARRLVIYSDSELMVKQMKGEYRVKNAGLMPLYEDAKRLVRDFDKVEFRHIRREENSRADWLCNQALDGFESPPDDLSQVVMPRGYDKAPRAAAPPLKEDVHKRAVGYLAEQAERWSRGDAADPDPAVVWQHLLDMIKEAGLVRSTASPRARRSAK